MKNYGKELILDIHNCQVNKFTRRQIRIYCYELCKLIDMKRGTLHFWDYKGYPIEYKKSPPHLKGISAVQFIKTSNITIHSLDDMKRVYINIFSCKPFNSLKAASFTKKYFKGTIINKLIIERM